MRLKGCIRIFGLITILIFGLSTFSFQGFSQSSSDNKPLRVGIAGLSHSHVHGLLGRPDRGDIQIVGIAEPNRELAQRLAQQYDFPMELVFDTLYQMISATQPEAVVAFGSIAEHLQVVRACAPAGIHVMVEKPLAINTDHAEKMRLMAEKHKIQLLTNYETSWYPSNHEAFKMIEENSIGALRKVVVHNGHKGPAEIGVNKEFLDWLTDPKQNGGGALYDFGCYGANLITWMKKGEKPLQVMAMTDTFKPDIYPQVDDEATILLKYPGMQGIIQASWNWPVARKDMELYGQTGYIICDNPTQMHYRLNENEDEQMPTLEKREPPFDDPFALFEAVIRNKITLQAYDPSSLENNMIVVEILEAAKKSAQTGKRVILSND